MSLNELTSQIYVDAAVLLEGHTLEVEGDEKHPVLNVDGGKLLLPAHRSYAVKDGEKVQLGSVTVHVRQNGKFYVSEKVLDLLK